MEDSDFELVPETVLNGLPFDCIVSICEYLSPRDLCRFGAACKVGRKEVFWAAFCG